MSAAAIMSAIPAKRTIGHGDRSDDCASGSMSSPPDTVVRSSPVDGADSVSYTHLTLPTIYSV